MKRICILLMILFLVACGTSPQLTAIPTETSTPVPSPSPEPTPTFTPPPTSTETPALKESEWRVSVDGHVLYNLAGFQLNEQIDQEIGKTGAEILYENTWFGIWNIANSIVNTNGVPKNMAPNREIYDFAKNFIGKYKSPEDLIEAARRGDSLDVLVLTPMDRKYKPNSTTGDITTVKILEGVDGRVVEYVQYVPPFTDLRRNPTLIEREDGFWASDVLGWLMVRMSGEPSLDGSNGQVQRLRITTQSRISSNRVLGSGQIVKPLHDKIVNEEERLAGVRSQLGQLMWYFTYMGRSIPEGDWAGSTSWSSDKDREAPPIINVRAFCPGGDTYNEYATDDSLVVK